MLLQPSILAFEGVKEDVQVVFLCGEVICEASVEVSWLYPVLFLGFSGEPNLSKIDLSGSESLIGRRC